MYTLKFKEHCPRSDGLFHSFILLSSIPFVYVCVCIYIYIYIYVYGWAKLYLTLCALRTVSHQVSLSMGFSRQEYWSGWPCFLPGDLPNPGIEPVSPMSPILAGGFFTTCTTWAAQDIVHACILIYTSHLYPLTCW